MIYNVELLRLTWFYDWRARLVFLIVVVITSIMAIIYD